MVHRLLLIRHAQAHDDRVDERRALTDRGRADAGAMGRWLRETGVITDLALVSPALRAMQTWEAIAGELPDAVTVSADERIYDNRGDGLVAMIEEGDDDVTTMAVVGHNPSMHALASRLAGESHGSEMADFPTATVAVFTVESWLRLESARLAAVRTCRAA